MPIVVGNTSITGLGAGGLPSGSVTAGNLASTLDLSTKTITFPAGKTADSPKYESPWVLVNQGCQYFFAHGLGRQPYQIRAYCKWDNANDNKPWLMMGDLGVWGANSNNDYGLLAAVSNSLIALASGEGGISGDWGGNFNSGFPTNDNALESYYSSYGQNSGNDFLDTPTETAGLWSNAWMKVYAW